MRIVWARTAEEHPEFGRLDEGREFEAPDELAAAWIEQGAAQPVAAAIVLKAAKPPKERQG